MKLALQKASKAAPVPQGPAGVQGPQGPAGPITTGSTVMLPLVNGTAPPPPTGYGLRGYTLLASKPNGGGQVTSYAVFIKESYTISAKGLTARAIVLTERPENGN